MNTYALDATCRPVGLPDLAQVQGFLTQQMKANQMVGVQPEAYYRWKFFSGAQRFCFGAFVDGNLVGFLGRMCRPFLLDDRAYVISEGTDAFMDRRYQGTGLFQRLIAAARRAVVQAGVAFSSARPNRNSQPGALRAGHRRLCDLELHTRPLSADYVASRLTSSAMLRAMARQAFAAAHLVGHLPLHASRLAGLRLERVMRFDERMDDLWQAARPRFQAGVVHDRAYMNWRYVECPVGYQRFALLEGDRLRGVAVGKLVPAHGEEPVSAEIVDLITGSQDRGPLAYLLVAEMLRSSRREGAQVIRCLSPTKDDVGEDPLRVALKLHGFVRRPAADTALLVRPEADEDVVERLIQRGSWRFRGGDIDSV